jgi:hypothetical protein
MDLEPHIPSEGIASLPFSITLGGLPDSFEFSRI